MPHIVAITDEQLRKIREIIDIVNAPGSDYHKIRDVQEFVNIAVKDAIDRWEMTFRDEAGSSEDE